MVAAVAAPASVRPSLTLSGIIAPAQSVAISSSLAEPAISVPVQEGEHVRAGQVLAVLDTSDLKATLNYDLQNAQANQALTAQNVYSGQASIAQGGDQVRQAQANVQSAQATLANARRDLQRDQQLLAQGYLSQQVYQTQLTLVQNDDQAVRNAQAALGSAQANQAANGTMSQGLQAAKVAQARAQSQASLAQADQTRVSIGKATIVSPIDGVVVNRNLNVGEYPGTRQIFTLQETDYVFAILGASSSEVFTIPTGAPVTVSVNGRPGTLGGKVVAVLDQLTPGSTNFAVKARVPNQSGILHSGMAVTTKIALNAISGIGVPYTAFLDDNHNTLMAIGADDTVHVVNVAERGTDGQTAIVQGLSSGTRVVANGQAG
ncbi:MAG: efflux RND transporter periplasmic adaptor subunit, partial [Candidatus Eremiobacteraeota bacterium]|nr:efflux RND transporter periplasmic adaptor subunit [Candidatus Eremiobacteraeota bacterium]